MKRFVFHSCRSGLGFLFWAIVLSAQAAMTNVNITAGFAFDPSTVAINVNDSVKWTWQSSPHSTTSGSFPTPSGLWDSGLHSAGFTFTNVFRSSGNFPYFCSQHSFMIGSVTVSAGNQPPLVAITNPVSGATFSAPWTSTMQATASDPNPGGSVTKVEFFNNSTLLGSVASSPFNLTVSNLPAANYALTAVATDNLGATNTSATVTVSVVTPVSIVVSDPQQLPPTEFRFTYTANAGLRYAVERSAILTNFVRLLTNTATGSSVTFTDSAAGGSQNFYRVGRLPNP